MTDQIKIIYEQDDVEIQLTANCDYDNQNLPYQLAIMFSRVIKDTRVNSDVVLEQIASEFRDND